MDANTPAWLRDNTVEAPAAPAAASLPDAKGVITSVAAPPPPAVDRNDTTDDNPDLPGVILTMRLANIGVSIAMIVVSVIVLLSFSAFSHLVLAIYAIFGSLLICCLETQLKFIRVMIALNFGFLFNAVWRFIYYLMLGSIAWSYDNILGRIMGISFCGVAVFNTYVLLRFPEYRKIRERIAEEEDRRIEAKISKDVKKRMASQIMK